MHDVMKMAGAITSHALWNVSDGTILSPLFGVLGADQSHRMERIMMGSAQAVAYGASKLESLAPDTRGAVLVKDGLVTLPTGRTDALIVDVRFTEDPGRRFQLLMPYRNASHSAGFAVHRIKLTEKEGIADEALDHLLGAFIEGIESHEHGALLWKQKYIDQAGEGAPSAGEENTGFAPEEFRILKQSLFHVLLLVGKADGSIDKKEVASLARAVQDPERFSSPLLNRIATNVIEEFSSWFLVSAMGDDNYYHDELARARDLVDARLTAQESLAFKRALLAIANEVANASGGLFSRVSRKEQAALAAIAATLGLEAS